jgi:hypothetical protein
MPVTATGVDEIDQLKVSGSGESFTVAYAFSEGEAWRP